MKGMEVKAPHIFLPSSLAAGEQSVSSSGTLLPGKSLWYLPDRRLSESRTSFDDTERQNCPHQEINPGHLSYG
jgi:hypothetical protein